MSNRVWSAPLPKPVMVSELISVRDGLRLSNPLVSVIAKLVNGNRGMSKPRRAVLRHGGCRPGRDRMTHSGNGNVKRAEIDRWRRYVRPVSLADLAASAASIRWSPALIEFLCEELHITDAVEEALGTRIGTLQ
jgi:hypothetical protein